jgi:two-component system cell cycle response regulator DivK
MSFRIELKQITRSFGSIVHRNKPRPLKVNARERAAWPHATTKAVGDKPVVLVVDDDPDARTIYSMYLRAAGCHVFTANDGRAAIDKTTTLWPDIVVMDLAMPRLNGWEAIRSLQESSWTRQIPIIAVSAVPVSRETAFDAGCDAYLTKPCDPQVLWSQIRALLRLAPSPSVAG